MLHGFDMLCGFDMVHGLANDGEAVMAATRLLIADNLAIFIVFPHPRKSGRPLIFER
jgi:hypothetical protein